MPTYPGSIGTETTHYIGGVTEKMKRGSSTQYRNLIQIGSVQIIARRNSGGQAVRYLTTDALGSADRIIDAAGASLANVSFSAFRSVEPRPEPAAPTTSAESPQPLADGDQHICGAAVESIVQHLLF